MSSLYSSRRSKVLAYVLLVAVVPLFLLFVTENDNDDTMNSNLTYSMKQQLRRKLGKSLQLTWVIKNKSSSSTSSDESTARDEGTPTTLPEENMIPVGSNSMSTEQFAVSKSSSLSSFNYNYVWGDPLGPENWHTLVSSKETTVKNYCNLPQNYMESPINVQSTTNECNLVRPLQIYHADSTRTTSQNKACRYDTNVSFDITKYGLQINLENCERPRLLLPHGLGVFWTFTNLQLKMKSEHFVHGQQYDGELQLEHQHTKDDPSRTIVAILLDASGYTPNLLMEELLVRWEKSWSKIQQTCNSGEAVSSSKDNNNEHDSLSFPYERLWKEAKLTSTTATTTATTTTSFFQYDGTQTVPPCQSGVSWVILEHPITISKSQFKRLAKLMERYIDPTSCEEYPTIASVRGEISRPLAQRTTLGQSSSSSKSGGLPIYHCRPSMF